MNLLARILTFPFTAPIDTAMWTARKLAERAEEIYYDDAPVRAALMELEMKLDLGEIDEDQFEEEEAVLLQRLKDIREYKASQATYTAAQ